MAEEITKETTEETNEETTEETPVAPAALRTAAHLRRNRGSAPQSNRR